MGILLDDCEYRGVDEVRWGIEESFEVIIAFL
jgi:hypothetical protein